MVLHFDTEIMGRGGGYPSYLSMCLALEWEECNTHAMTDTIHATVRHTVITMIIILKSDF